MHGARASPAERTAVRSETANGRSTRHHILCTADKADAPCTFPNFDPVSAREARGLIERLSVGLCHEINPEGSDARFAKKGIGTIIRH